ncbi:fibronectin type III domain-containing protein [Paludisphaera sp.]|uniref:fibronectin type III domain-containing protein n=1 Tax=Paludisphaera sp. TaxID=2017432 RepID=UPI00301C462A
MIASGGIALGGAGRPANTGIVYRIYSNGGHGPIDYESPLAEAPGLEWTSQALPAGSSFRFAARAHDPVTGLQDGNLDATASLVIDAGGRDATRVPRPPMGLRVVDRGGGRVRLEWAVADATPSYRATHFHVYLREGAVTDFTSPILVPASSWRGDVASAEIHGLLEGRRYAAVVRAANAHGEDGNVDSIFFTADHTPPARVDGLSGPDDTNAQLH